MGYGNGGVLGVAAAAQYETERLLANQGTSGPARQSMVAVEMDRLDSGTQQLHGFLSRLESRLELVTMASVPTPDGKPNAVPTPGVPLAAGLADINLRVAHACARLESLLSRIEL